MHSGRVQWRREYNDRSDPMKRLRRLKCPPAPEATLSRRPWFLRQLEPVTYHGPLRDRCWSALTVGIRWYGDSWGQVSILFAGHEVGLEEVDHGLFEVYFGPIWLGRFVEPKRLIFDSLGRGQRRTGGTCKGRRTVT